MSPLCGSASSPLQRGLTPTSNPIPPLHGYFDASSRHLSYHKIPLRCRDTASEVAAEAAKGLFCSSSMSLVVVFLLGLVAMAEGFLLWLLPEVGILAFAAALMLIVLTGFAIRNPGWRQVSVPALPVSGRRLMEGMYSAEHPQVFRFRIDLRNLYLLNLATLYAVALAILALSGKYARVFSYEFPMTVGIVLAAYCLFLAITWLNERRLLKTSIAAMGLVDPPHPVNLKPSFGYQYFDQNGQRRGGIVPFHRRLMSKPDLFTPVFFSANNAEFCKPGFAFLFHRFEIAESRHAAAFIAERT